MMNKLFNGSNAAAKMARKYSDHQIHESPVFAGIAEVDETDNFEDLGRQSTVIVRKSTDRKRPGSPNFGSGISNQVYSDNQPRSPPSRD